MHLRLNFRFIRFFLVYCYSHTFLFVKLSIPFETLLDMSSNNNYTLAIFIFVIVWIAMHRFSVDHEQL